MTSLVELLAEIQNLNMWLKFYMHMQADKEGRDSYDPARPDTGESPPKGVCVFGCVYVCTQLKGSCETDLEAIKGDLASGNLIQPAAAIVYMKSPAAGDSSV